MTDPIADMLTRIRNAVAVKKAEVLLPFSKVKFNIAKVLEKENYVSRVEKTNQGKLPVIKIVLKYEDGRPAITHLKRISKPGQKIYVNNQEIKKVLNGYGLSIISTSRGLLTDQEARQQKLGGELMCEIW